MVSIIKSEEEAESEIKSEKDLTSTTSTSNTNVFHTRMQMLLTDLKADKKLNGKVEKWFSEFKSFIDNMNESSIFDIKDYANLVENIKLPLSPQILPKESSKGLIKWTRPTDIELIGSWTYSTFILDHFYLDVLLHVPEDYYKKSEYLNHKYHQKRAIYLAYLAMNLSKRGDNVKYICTHDPLRPNVTIETKYFKVLLHCTPPKDFFKVGRLIPDMNNLRFEYFFDKSLPEDEPEPATPNYNSSILSDYLILQTQNLIYKTLEKSKIFVEAIKLLKIWLHQRSLNKGYGSFSNHILTLLVCYLADKMIINASMNIYQILRMFFVQLSQIDLINKGIAFSGTENDQNQKSVIKNMLLHFDVVFVDPTGSLNYTSSMSKYTFKRVQREAKLAINILDSQLNENGFHQLFLVNVPFILNFDQVLQLEIDEKLAKRLGNKNLSEVLNYSGHFFPIGVSLVGDIIEKTLGKRIELIDIDLLPQGQAQSKGGKGIEWNLKEERSKKTVLRFGLIINREKAYKLVEKCGGNEEEEEEMKMEDQNQDNLSGKGKEISVFKEFWGEKSVFRRFPDGSLIDSVIFAQDETRVSFEMLKYTLNKHLNITLYDKPDMNINSGGSFYIDCQLEKLLNVNLLKCQRQPNSGRRVIIKKNRKIKIKEDPPIPLRTEQVTEDATKVIEKLSKILRDLDGHGLPLNITSVQALSSTMRFTNPHPTPPQRFFPSNLITEDSDSNSSLKLKNEEYEELEKMPKYVEPIEILIQLESSGKWPDNLEAIGYLKCAFLLKIGEILKNKFDIVNQTFKNYSDILMNGFIFRLRVTYYREIILLKQKRGKDGVLRIRENPEAALLERNSLILPQLTTTLHSFHRQHSSFGPTCCIAKRWMASQLLLAYSFKDQNQSSDIDNRFTEESIELLVAFSFQNFTPHLSPPQEAQIGFLRFLHLLANYEWNSSPIILNFFDKLTPEEVEGINSDFVKRRASLPPIFIATAEDKTRSVWTRKLSPIVLNRGIMLAKTGLDLITQNNAALANLQIKSQIFQPSLTHFNALIWIKNVMHPRRHQRINIVKEEPDKNAFIEYSKVEAEKIPIVSFDPVELLLGKLRKLWGNLALFFNDIYGGNYIAIVFKPQILTAKGSKGNTKAREILESIRIIGDGLIDKIELVDNNDN